MATDKKPIGRPPLEPGKARTSMLRTMVRPSFARDFQRAAKRTGVSVSDALLEAAQDWMKKSKS